MAYAPMRSMNAELASGASDGRYKKVVEGRGGFPETATYQEREDLHDMHFGIHEKQLKELPGFVHPEHTQAYRATPQADPWH